MSHVTRVGIQTYDGRFIPSNEDIELRDHAQRKGKSLPHVLDGVPEVPYSLAQQVTWAGETPIKATRDSNGYLLLGPGFERMLMGSIDRDRPVRLYLEVGEIALLLGISKSTVLKHIDQRRLVSNRPTNRHRIPVSSFVAFCRECGYDDDQLAAFVSSVRAMLNTSATRDTGD